MSGASEDGRQVTVNPDGSVAAESGKGAKATLTKEGTLAFDIGKLKMIGVRDLTKVSNYEISKNAEGTQHSIKFLDGATLAFLILPNGTVGSLNASPFSGTMSADGTSLISEPWEPKG